MGMCIRISLGLATLAVMASATHAADEELFNGKNLDGWTYHAENDQAVAEMSDAWVVKDGMLISTGLSSGYLLHAKEYENCVLTLEWRTMSTEEGNGVAVGDGDSVYLHTADELGSFNAPKSIEVSLGDPGAVYFRDVKPFDETQEWAFHAPAFADDVERDMGEWNQVKIISNGKRLTVFTNGIAVNQINEMTRTKGAIALKCSRGFVAAPTFYRALRVQPISAADIRDEQKATAQLAKFKAADAAQEAARAAARRAEEQAEQAKAAHLAADWTNLEVTQEIEFRPEARFLPFPANPRELEFDATFEQVTLTVPMSLAEAAVFYRQEMTRRGWQVTETDFDDDSVNVIFKHGDAEVDLTLDEQSDGVDIELECAGLSFAGTNDPAALAALGIPQPKG